MGVRVHYMFLYSKKICLKHSTCKTSAGCRARFPLLVEIFHFGRKIFCSSGHTSTPNFIPNRGSGIFFHFSGKFSTSKKKKNFIPKSHELEHSAEVEFFPLLVENFPLW